MKDVLCWLHSDFSYKYVHCGKFKYDCCHQMFSYQQCNDRYVFPQTNVIIYKLVIELICQQEYCQQNYLLGTYDVPLTAVGAVWVTDGGPVKRRRLKPYGDMPGKVKGLQIVCKVLCIARNWHIRCAAHSLGCPAAQAVQRHAGQSQGTVYHMCECSRFPYKMCRSLKKSIIST